MAEVEEELCPEANLSGMTERRYLGFVSLLLTL